MGYNAHFIGRPYWL